MSVVILPECERIAVGDPLLVKVVANNRSRRDLPFQPPLFSMTCNLNFTVVDPDDVEHPVPLPNISHVIFPRTGGGFQPAAEFVSYECLFRVRQAGNDTPVFSTKGVWRLKAHARVGSGVYTSEPVAITVLEPTERAREGLRKYSQSIRAACTYATPLDDDAVALLKLAEPTVESTNAGHTVRRALLVAEVYRAKTPQARADAVRRLEEFTRGLGPLRKEYTDLLLGFAYLHCAEYAAAWKIYNDTAARSNLTFSLGQTLSVLDPKKE